MTASPEYIQAKLEARVNAWTSDFEAKNNRYHYNLVFDENIGWDWLEKQVERASSETERSLELYKFGPVEGATGIVVEVREVNRRADIDDDQHGLGDFS